MPARSGGRAVFVRLDGVLLDAAGASGRPLDVHWRAGALAGLHALRRAGWRTVGFTHQPGIALGLFGPAAFETLASALHAELAGRGLALDGVHLCPHLPDAPLAAWRRHCDCRPPAPGLMRRAARDLALDLGASVVVGASAEDVAAGRAAGLAAAIRLADGLDLASCDIAQPPADFTCATLAEAADWLLAHERQRHA